MTEPVRTYTNRQLIEEMIKNAIKMAHVAEKDERVFQAGYLFVFIDHLMERFPNEVLAEVVDRVDWQLQIMEREGLK